MENDSGHVIDYFHPYRKLFGASFALVIFVELGLLAFPIATQMIFDNVMLNGFYKHLFLLPYTYFVKRTSGDNLSLGEFVAFTVMFTSFLFSLESISRLFGEWSEARISMERLNDVYESTVEHPYPDSMRILPRIQGHLRFDNVSFAYGQGSKPVLHNVSVELTPGLNVALVGRSGSGKSTIANLLFKLFGPTQGGGHISMGIHCDRYTWTLSVSRWDMSNRRPLFSEGL